MKARAYHRKAIGVLAKHGTNHRTIAAFLGDCASTITRWCSPAIPSSSNLYDRPRCGHPLSYSEDIQTRIIGFYCQTHPLPECGRWTFRWAARRLKAEPERIGATPSKSSIHRILKKNALKPHRSRYFLHITDPDFFPKMEHLVALYLDPPRHLFFFDECPGIQILKRLTPHLQTQEMKIRLEEFEYIRNGTMDVFAFLSNSDGSVMAKCRADHTTQTFLSIFEAHASGFASEEKLDYVMDNLSTHRGYPFCKLVAQLSEVECPSQEKLSTQIKRAQWLQSEEKRVVIHFTPFHGSWLNRVEVWFSILSSKVLGESFGSFEELKQAFESFLKDWNELLAHPFKWSYGGEGLHEKAVKRFIAMLGESAHKMEISALTKQLKLMANLIKHYYSKVSSETWIELMNSMSFQGKTLKLLIDQEKGPRRKKNAQQALQAMIRLSEKHREGSLDPVT